MSLAQANKNLKYDKRMTENKINAGEMTKEEWQKHLEQLPDLAHNVETFTMDGKNTKDDDNH
ncbi:hypothetical protein AB1A81_04935 [Bdellovibrio bacteriovorus]|uniref:Uncharacterized protein n=2 Tax=Bdellovibrio bacteriovorus TaxID=959 RepID=Q6MP00_BDEBA|nr:hypothetical protein [Bdellovibrio bacteriovorus]AFY00712.1 hypothetical protein Bdt_1012 [Bdellovibrio bacteriovorus str. Tiberius]AHZ86314.1 hypothetical protein EP01_15425 [Bdellovibrio bacteriovorus]BEV67552.1 hypothetical protein Bb109J_c0972 [Bdellovibrio bacteriovorus]CAE78999.1 conserved hypothetical protein [Bdellovibrio bacteriovorus HD100]